jgi:hypothetical protein
MIGEGGGTQRYESFDLASPSEVRNNVWLATALHYPSSKIAGNLPAESGVNFSLAPFAGYVNAGSGTSGQEFSGSSGSVAFPVGQSFGLFTNFTAASLGSNGLYPRLRGNYPVGPCRSRSLPTIGMLGGVAEHEG